MRNLTLLGCALLAACGGPPGSVGADAPIDATSLCVNSTCGSPRQIVDLPDLENLKITESGRVFVTGQQNFYEITRDAQGVYSAHSFFSGASGCSGMAVNGDTLYALCSGQSGGAAAPTDMSGLFALDLATPNAELQPIFSLAGMTLPNGMVWDAVGGYLYVTDGPIAADPKIVRLRIDAADPRHVLGQETWLKTFPQYPNGLAIRGRSLYTTLYGPDAGSVARVDILPDGTPSPLTVLYRKGIMDDLSTAGDTLLVTDWQGGAVFQLALDGTLLQTTDAGSFRQPSAVELASGPLFAPGELLVTERYSGRGLWLFSPIR